jgi:hypothetical protein
VYRSNRKSQAFRKTVLFIENGKIFLNVRILMFYLLCQQFFHFYPFFSRATNFGQLLRYESLEVGSAEKVFSASAKRRQSEAVYEYCELKPTK